MTRYAWLLALAVGVCPPGPPAPAGEAPDSWPQFRGPNGSGVAPDGMKLPVHFGPSKNALWKTPLPRGHSSPCVWGDRIFLTGFDPVGKKLETLCLDRLTGKVLWRRAAPAGKVENHHPISSPATATPATDGRRVYVYFGSCGLLCYDFDGKERWKKPLPVAAMRFGSGTSPVLAGGLLLLNRDHPPDPCLLAVHPKTGETAWKKPLKTDREGYSTPVLWAHDGVSELIVHHPDRLAAYALKDGAERWRVALTSEASSTPVLGDGKVFVAAWGFGSEPGDKVDLPTFAKLAQKYDKNKDGKLSRAEFPAGLEVMRRAEAGDIPGASVKAITFFDFIDTNKDGHIDRKEWDGAVALATVMLARQEHGLLAIQPGGRADPAKVRVAWKEKQGVPEVPSPVFYRERVYAVRDGGIVSCLDARTGKLLYRERLGPAGAYFSSPVAGDGKVYVASRRGVLVVFAAGDRLKVLARNDLRETITATPALAGGRIYVRTEGHLHAFGE